MDRRGPRKNRNIRKLTRMGGGHSFGITLPIGTMRKFGWRERQKLELKIDEKKKTVLIKDWKK